MGRTRVLLVRHGATELSAEDRFAGSTDALLGKEGEHQAALLSVRLAEVKISAVYASPMKRTIKTASIIAEPHKLEVKPVDGLKEIDHGRWETKTRAEVEAEFPEEYKSWDADPFTFAPTGGESGLQVLARSLPALRNIIEKHEGQTILVVSHKATIRLLVGSFLGFDLRKYRDNLDQLPACLNIIDFTIKKPIQARLILFNDISHYHKPEKYETIARLSRHWCEEEEEEKKKENK